MRLLLVQPPLMDETYADFRYFPGHMLALYSYLKRNNPGQSIEMSNWAYNDGNPAGGQDGAGGGLSYTDYLRAQLQKYAPDVLGISCYTSVHYIPTRLTAMIFKEENPDGIVIVGGFHPTVRPGDFNQPGAPYDYIIRGEGEVILSQLLKQPLRPREVAEVIDGIPLDLETEELILDDTPYLNRGDSILVFLSRGCPFQCNFCLEPLRSNSRYAQYRVVSPVKARNTVERILKTIEPAEIYLGDAVFGMQTEWRRQFLTDLGRLNLQTPVWAETRVDVFIPADLELLKPLPFRLDFGLDALLDENIVRQNKSRFPQQYRRLFLDLDETLNRLEIPHSVFMLYNFPGETPGSYDRTRQTIRDIAGSRAYNYTCFVGQPYCLYPGSYSYSRMREYERDYGSRFPADGWWYEIDDNRHRLASNVIASREMDEMDGRVIDFISDIRQLKYETIPDKDLLFWPLRIPNAKKSQYTV